MRERYVFWFNDLGQEHFSLVGKKCANLGEMTRLGLRVPPGFAISVDAYQDFLAQTGAGLEIEKVVEKLNQGTPGIDQFNEASRELRYIVESKDIPEEISGTILAFYAQLCHRCNVEKVAVSTRSAGPASRPGQYETYLNVIGESDLLDNVKKVWASTFNPRSLAFRARKGLPLHSDPIGVAVLKMVRARAAGVLLTVDPNTGNTGRMVIEGNWGLGESVVSGEETPDVYILNRDTMEVIERTLGRKSKYVTFKETSVAEEETPSDKRSTFCLQDEEIKEIGRMGIVLEQHFGVPQDIEWAVDEDLVLPDSVVLLQTRAAVIAPRKSPVDQVLDLMTKWF